MEEYTSLILRWSLGSQNTQTLSIYDESNKYRDYIWLAKLSVYSFQKWFPGARYVLLYNGYDVDEFGKLWNSIEPSLLYEVEIIDQCESLKNGTYPNPYHYFPIGVWWKWVPFRLDISKHEIAVDTDIICIGRPDSWYEWLEGTTSIVVAPERFEKVKVNTCGDLHVHPILRNQKPANCGVVGQRAGEEYAERFFETSKAVRFGYTHDSMFITEQGVVNLWIYSLLTEGVTHTILDFKRNAWARDFVYWMRNGVKVETVHAVAWHKTLVKMLKEAFESRVLRDSSDEEFLMSILHDSSQFNGFHKEAILQQLRPNFGATEYYLTP